MRESRQPRGEVHVVAAVSAVALVRLSYVQSHPDGERDGVVVLQRTLRLDRSPHGFDCGGEDHAEAIALSVEDEAAVALDRRVEDGVLRLYRGCHLGRR